MSCFSPKELKVENIAVHTPHFILTTTLWLDSALSSCPGSPSKPPDLNPDLWSSSNTLNHRCTPKFILSKRFFRDRLPRNDRVKEMAVFGRKSRGNMEGEF